jgi:hypothetical protein
MVGPAPLWTDVQRKVLIHPMYLESMAMRLLATTTEAWSAWVTVSLLIKEGIVQEPASWTQVKPSLRDLIGLTDYKFMAPEARKLCIVPLAGSAQHDKRPSDGTVVPPVDGNALLVDWGWVDATIDHEAHRTLHR